MIKSPDNFNWDIYENGYNGANLKPNKNVVVQRDGTRTKVYCHESYAQEMYNAYSNINTSIYSAKDQLIGSVLSVCDITPISNTEVIVDTVGGGSAKIDLIKDKDFVKMCGCETVDVFINSLNNSKTFKTSLLETLPVVKVVNSDRISLWEGHVSKTTCEFHQQIKKPTHAYYAYLESINNGGYIVVINNVKCFLPGSLAQANKINNYDALVGKTIPVMIDSYSEKTGFIVSYKKYLATILPGKIKNELYIGMPIDAYVTGTKKGNVFMQWADSNGDMIFTGLLPQDNMSNETKQDVANGQFTPDSKWRMFISDITENNRIVLSDSPVNTNIDQTTINNF